MSNIAKLAVSVTADALGFKATLDQSARHAQSWASTMAKTLKLALPTIGIGMIVSNLKSIVEEFDNIADNATRAGVNVKSFMNLVGALDAEDTGLVTEALKKLRKSMAELASGDASTVAKFAAAGLSGINPRDDLAGNLGKIAKAWDAAHGPLEKFTIEFAAFGKTGVEVSAVLDKLAEGDSGFNKFMGMDPEKFAKTKRAFTILENLWFNVRGHAARALTEGPMYALYDNAEAMYKPSFEAEKASKAKRPRNYDPNWNPYLGMSNFYMDQGTIEGYQQCAAEMEQYDFGEAIKSATEWLGKGKTFLDGWVRNAKDFTKEIKAAGLQTSAGTRTPLEQFQKSIADLQQQKLFGALSGDTFDRALAKTFLDLEQSLPQKVAADFTKTAPLLERGSAAEGSFRAQTEQAAIGGHGGTATNPQARVEEVLKQIKEKHDREVGELTDIARTLRDRLPRMGIAKMGG